MKQLAALLFLGLLLGCGTRPPLPPDCEGALTPINAPAGATEADHGPRSGP